MSGGRFDWLAELGGAAALAAAGGYAAFKLAPSMGLAAPSAMLGGGFGFLAIGLLAMKAVGSGPRRLSLPELAIEPIETTGEDVLLLDTPHEEPLLLEEIFDEPADDALLLEDALPGAGPDSRVVQLFAHPVMPTAGELKDRIDRHLAGAPRLAHSQMPELQRQDASDALYAALDELKRSLR